MPKETGENGTSGGGLSLREMVAEAQAKTAELKTLTAQGDALAGDDLARAESLMERLKALKPQIESHRKTLADLSGDLEDYDSFLHAPAGGPEHPASAGGDGASADGGRGGDGGELLMPGLHQKALRFAGVERAGEASLEFDAYHRVKHFYQSGPGVFGAKQWAAISSKSYVDAYVEYLRKGLTDMGRTARKALEEGADPQGGYLTPTDVLARIISRQATPTRLGGLVQTVTTSRDAVSVPRLAWSDGGDVYTTGFRVKNAGEKPKSAKLRVDDANLFGTHRIPINTFMFSGVLSNDQVEDSAFDVLGWFADKFRETIDLHRDNMILNGTGIGEPEGLLMDPGGENQPAVTVSGAAIEPFFTPDALLDISGLVPEQYDSNCRYVMNKTQTFRRLRKLKDKDDRYLFGAGTQDSGLANGRPTNLNGYPYIWSGFMPNPAANSFPLLFGDLSGWLAVNRIGLSIQLLRDSRYAEENTVGVLGRVRWGGKLIEPWKFRIMKVSA